MKTLPLPHLYFLLLLLPGLALADFNADWARMEEIHPQTYRCLRATGPIRIDGKLDDSSWKRAPWSRNFVDIATRVRPRFRTRIKMLWDDRYFYIGAELEEPHVWGTLTNHDAVIFQDNDFEVFIDPDGDSHNYYEFEINALNTGWDLLLKKPYKDGGPALNSWEIPGLKTAVHISGTLNHPGDQDQGWSVELAFPWEVLQEFAGTATPPKEGDQWRCNFSRIEWQTEIGEGKYVKVPKRPEDNWVWSPMGIIDMHRPENWGYVEFTKSPVDPGKPVLPGPDARPRRLLQRIYYGQKAFQEKNKRWAARLPELGLPDEGWPTGLEMKTTTEGFEASTGSVKDPRRRWHIRQDARIWME